MHPYFFITMKEEPEAVATLISQLQFLAENRRLILADRAKAFILACLSHPGSLYEILRTLQEKDISYAEIIHSSRAPEGLPGRIEVQRFHFDRKPHWEVAQTNRAALSARTVREVRAVLKKQYPQYDLKLLGNHIKLLWLNNRDYVQVSPARRIAQVLWLFYMGNNHGGVYVDVEKVRESGLTGEYRVFFAAANPPEEGFLAQTMETFKRLDIGIQRTYCLIISNGVIPYFLGTFYVHGKDQEPVIKGTALFDKLSKELYNTQILSSSSASYLDFVREKVMTGEDASLVNAFIAFCHTNLAHSQPEVYELEAVQRAFHTHPEMPLQLVRLFRSRFDPELKNREKQYRVLLIETETAIENYNTGHRFLDDFRRTIFRCCLGMIRNTLKTNFFISGKQALAFRLDPSYLSDLPPEFTSDLPERIPFRITFFFGRYGVGYHIGFSDIARGGWRTILTSNRDDYVTTADSLFKEVYVLAHTQHLKNKDIYEGGSKMAIVADVRDIDEPELIRQRMYKLQYGIISAFLDIFITDDGRARDPRIVDYYLQDEPIELGPDENMHDAMVQTIAHLSQQRGYILGQGIISSKKFGINHKEYGVTSTGVIKFAERVLKELGINAREDPWSVIFTGGTNGDVAGNAIRILMERCPKVKIKLVLDGTGALFDPGGANHRELKRILFKGDIDAFNPSELGDGGLILYRSRKRTDGLKEKYLRIRKSGNRLVKNWVSVDEFHREYDSLIFSVPADMFIPAGGRPETVHDKNWARFLRKESGPSVRAIVEGANSFITPGARESLQKSGVVIMRDASANKCGVISSSYEVIANLLMKEEEFQENKDRYVRDVLEILEKRSESEADIILSRHSESGGGLLYTQITRQISGEINELYERLFEFFSQNPETTIKPLFRKTLLSHLPRLLRESRRYRSRIRNMPEKYLFAMLSSEIASSLVYKSNRETDFMDMVEGHLKRVMRESPESRVQIPVKNRTGAVNRRK
jgi:glutamate dehydrogenase